jgi:hypothetical protein
LAAAAFIAVVAGRAQSPALRTRSIYVAVTDNRSMPVAGLTAAELSIKEDGKVRTVVRLEPAATRLAIAVLADDGGVGLNDIRSGIAGFMDRLLSRADFSLVGIAEQNRTLVDLTHDGSELLKGIQALRVRTVNGGGHLLEGVLDAVKKLNLKQETVRPVVLIVTNQAREYGTVTADSVLTALAQTGTTLYVVEVSRLSGQSRGPAPAGADAVADASRANEDADADRARGKILSDGPRETGGRREELLASADVPATLISIAEELANQYILVYSTDAAPGITSRIALSTTRKNAKVRGPARASDKPLHGGANAS